jgi:hypothetical protein
VLADVQTLGQLAVINPATLAVTHRVPLPGCDHDHGLTLEPPDRLAFIAWDSRLFIAWAWRRASRRLWPGPRR